MYVFLTHERRFSTEEVSEVSITPRSRCKFYLSIKFPIFVTALRSIIARGFSQTHLTKPTGMRPHVFDVAIVNAKMALNIVGLCAKNTINFFGGWQSYKSCVVHLFG